MFYRPSEAAFIVGNFRCCQADGARAAPGRATPGKEIIILWLVESHCCGPTSQSERPLAEGVSMLHVHFRKCPFLSHPFVFFFIQTSFSFASLFFHWPPVNVGHSVQGALRVFLHCYHHCQKEIHIIIFLMTPNLTSAFED